MLHIRKGKMKFLDSAKHPTRTFTMLRIYRSAFYHDIGHTTTNLLSDGGAVHAEWLERVEIRNSLFVDNKAESGGAIYALSINNMELVNNKFGRNRGRSAGRYPCLKVFIKVARFNFSRG